MQVMLGLISSGSPLNLYWILYQVTMFEPPRPPRKRKEKEEKYFPAVAGALPPADSRPERAWTQAAARLTVDQSSRPCHGLPRAATGCHGLPRAATGCHGLPPGSCCWPSLRRSSALLGGGRAKGVRHDVCHHDVGQAARQFLGGSVLGGWSEQSC